MDDNKSESSRAVAFEKTLVPITIDEIHRLKGSDKELAWQRYYAWLKAQRKIDRRIELNRQNRIYRFYHPEKVKSWQQRSVKRKKEHRVPEFDIRKGMKSLFKTSKLHIRKPIRKKIRETFVPEFDIMRGSKRAVHHFFVPYGSSREYIKMRAAARAATPQYREKARLYYAKRKADPVVMEALREKWKRSRDKKKDRGYFKEYYQKRKSELSDKAKLYYRGKRDEIIQKYRDYYFKNKAAKRAYYLKRYAGKRAEIIGKAKLYYQEKRAERSAYARKRYLKKRDELREKARLNYLKKKNFI
jgi:hypothetical protein